MKEKEFNLLSEPWIRVIKGDCRVEEVSLADALINAHEYKDLAGELPTQNAAILRLLLAVLHAVFERVDIEGDDRPLESPDDALDRWSELWENRRFPQRPLETYFESQRENFWLFHPERPFWQINEIKEGEKTQSEPVKKINGAISESNNKIRIFAERTQGAKDSLSNAEAARWLVYLNQYDDNTLKTGVGVAFLGQIASLIAKGSNLFETLMLNFVLLDQSKEVWDLGQESWAKDFDTGGKVITVAFPHSLIEVLSYHSRNGKLNVENGKLLRYVSTKGGYAFETINRNEQMSLWRHNEKDDTFSVVRSMYGCQFWRELPFMFNGDYGYSLLSHWHSVLQHYHYLDNSMAIIYEVIGVLYDKAQHSSVEDVYYDSVSIHLGLISDLGKQYQIHISDEIQKCHSIATLLGNLSYDLFIAAGGDKEKKGHAESNVYEEFFYNIDVPFRKWLFSLNPKDGDIDNKVLQWRHESEVIALSMAEKMVKEAGPAAFKGKFISISKDNNKKRFYSSSTAMNTFRINMSKLKGV